MNELQVFNHKKFGAVRGTVVNGEPWFVASDVAGVLNYNEPSHAIRDHCKKANKITLPAAGSDRPPLTVLIIPESDVYRLIMRSQLPKAVEFQDWVVEEVLPALRRTGHYEMPTAKKADKLPEGAIQTAITLREIARGKHIKEDARGALLAVAVVTTSDLPFQPILTLSLPSSTDTAIKSAALQLEQYLSTARWIDDKDLPNILRIDVN